MIHYLMCYISNVSVKMTISHFKVGLLLAYATVQKFGSLLLIIHFQHGCIQFIKLTVNILIVTKYYISNKCFFIFFHQRILENFYHKNIKQHNCFQH